MEQYDVAGYYHLFELPDDKRAAQFIRELASTPSQGMNVTFPYKQIALEVADRIDNSAKKAGSANVISYRGDIITAHNTDITGFAKFLHAHDLEIYKSALIVGAGSAGRTVAQVLLEEGMEVTFVNRNRERFNELSPDLKQATTQLVYHDYNLSEIYDLYINSTTLGYDGVLVTDFIDFNNEIKAVIDLNYGRDKTPLVRYAEQRGMTAFDGKEMLFHQAADAFEIWTNCKIAREKAFEEFLRVLK
jgi:shikimate dehydrogenase